MINIKTLCLVALIASPSIAHGQRRRTPKAPAVPLTEQVATALAEYDFEYAEQLLDKEVASLKKKRKPTDHLDSLLHRARQGQSMLHATERIAVIDSVVCPKDEALKHIRLSRESGRVDSYSSSFLVKVDSPATVYENELSNKRYFALPGTMHLAVADKIGDQWSDPVELRGLNDDDVCQNYPFLLSDGLTLYYAATGPASIGGYDIFVSRADGEDGTFLAPENVGFPFNSTSNDYLLAIDELNQLGWFVSDRHQSAGNVCVYTFIPNATREVYGDDVDDDELRRQARLTSIRSTWSNAVAEDETAEGVPAAVVAAQQRLSDVRSGKVQHDERVAHDFCFVIDDSRTYTSLGQFRSAEARQMMSEWLSLSKTEQTDATMLQRLRDSYAVASSQERRELSETILRLEADYFPLVERIKQLAKAIRNTEILH